MKQYTIEKLDHQGRGIIKESGKVIFVENALPGELVQIQIVKEKKSLKEAKVITYDKKSVDRIDPLCPYYTICGGCHIMHMEYEKQLIWKQEKVTEILNKFVDNSLQFPIQPIIGCEEYNYRNKATFQVQKKIGYYEKESNHIVSIDHCNLVDYKINMLLPVLEALNTENCSQIIIRASKNMEQTMIVFVTKKFIDKQLIIKCLSPYVTSIYVKGNQLECIYGKTTIQDKIGNFIFEISPDSFFQVNTNQAKKLYDIVLRYANLNKEDCVLDLYCGTGTIGLYISPYCHKVLGVEVNSQAISDAKNNQKLNQVNNIEFICGDVANIVNKMKEEYDVIIVDPPRSGLDPKTMSYLKKSNAKRIVYVSCDPVTLARDLNQLKEIYQIKELTPVDMFPNTYHVECVCVLNRR